MLEDTKTHWRRHADFRKESLTQIITGLDKSIIILQKQIEEIPWYDGDWFREESEPIYGLLFVAFQNYIIGSIKDFTGSTSEKEKYYRIGENWRHYPKTSIELIIGLANYSKHKDDDSLFHKGTRHVLESFQLDINEDPYNDNSPIFKGLEILSDKWDMFEILEIVIYWREKLWASNETPTANKGYK